ncbi:MAG TPA: polysaccharide deacetylase family protein [Acidimicrobiales bacterium]|nr:polysaccharide deacetylase family protein [Acidimicrobiales bacterium]
MQILRASGRVIHAVAAGMAGSAMVAFGSPSVASAQAPPPARYTYQAPGGAHTAGNRVIALTFDDGPGPYTAQVLSVLERYHVPATFFEIGQNVAKYPQYTRMLAAAGYPVEDHTWAHADLTATPASKMSYQIDQTQNEIRSLTGQTPTCVRPPYNAWNAGVLDQMAQRGLTTMSYSIDPRDWTLPGTPAIVARVVGAASPGAVVDLHDAGGPRNETVDALPQIIGDLESEGYTFVSLCGQGPQASAVYGFGQAPVPGQPIVSNKSLVGAAISPQGGGYWLAGADGGVFAFGDAGFSGSLGAQTLNAPVVGIAADPISHGYWLAGADGGVFAFGDAGFYGSVGGQALNAPVVALAPAPDGGGYWLAAADGGVFAFGDAGFSGSLGAQALNAPVVGIAADPTTHGYWLAAADGGVFAFGAAGFYGSRGGQGAPGEFFALCPTAGGGGYLLAGQLPA